MEQKLSKAQVGTLHALAIQKMQVQQAFAEILEAEKEQFLVLAKYYNLPDGEYSVRQEEDGSVFLTATVLEETDGENKGN